MGGSRPPNWHVSQGPPEFLAASCTCGLSPPHTWAASSPPQLWVCGGRMNCAPGGVAGEQRPLPHPAVIQPAPGLASQMAVEKARTSLPSDLGGVSSGHQLMPARSNHTSFHSATFHPDGQLFYCNMNSPIYAPTLSRIRNFLNTDIADWAKCCGLP